MCDDESAAPTSIPLEYSVAGLGGAVEILVDRWGVPHIYAGDDHDLYVAQGFNAARDRLFQLDMGRRRGLGALSEVLGPEYLEQDRAARLLLYRGDLEAEWAAYGPESHAVVSAFVTGINAYVHWVSERPGRLPPEFRRWGFRPALWEPEDVVRIRTHGLFFNVEHEVARSMTIRDAGECAERVRQAREPDAPYAVPAGLDLDSIGDDLLRTYRLAFSPVQYPADGPPADPPPIGSGDGSNNWVIGSERSATGRPLVANDPHRAVTLPSLRYVVHLESPTTRVIGGGEPALPGVSIGHNDDVAFGLTIWFADQEDLYVYELDPADACAYRYDGGWERFTTVVERIAVSGAENQVVELRFSRHGPIIYTDVDRGIAVALRAAWLEPGTVPYLGSLRYLHSRTAEEFRASLAGWGAPSVNHVYADRLGGIGWQTAAKVPRRPGWDGGFPVPGDGRYEWDGFVAFDELPSVRDPEQGWFTTSNQMNLPPGYDNDALTITYDWPSSGRHRRLREWLASEAEIGVAASVAMQFDAVSQEATEIVARLGRIDPDGLSEADLLSRLQRWDGNETIDSFEAAVFEIWLRRHFRPWLVQSTLGSATSSEAGAMRIRGLGKRDDTLGSDLRGDVRLLDELLARPERLLQLRTAIDKTLRDACDELGSLLGPDRSTWTWGRLHHAALENPALAGAPDAPARLGPFPRAGSGDTVGMATYDANFRQTIGSSFRVVMDVGKWDHSRVVNAPGQSGDPRSPHYDDLFKSWCEGETFPLCFSRSAVEEHTENTIILRPAQDCV
ncbi:MAG TPA: penicillin acylase family protein [Amycolatopsis sp.]|nr:penicillin acylase family protein [Amycolatopsis sp.]